MERRYTVKRGKLTGKSTVHFNCGKCGATLEAPLNEAGDNDRCPECQSSFIVPGEAERRAEREKELADERAEEEERKANEVRDAELTANAERLNQLHKEKTAAKKRRASRTRGLMTLGFVLGVLGLVLLLRGLLMDTTTQTTVSLENLSGRVHNIGLLNTKLSLCVVGSCSFIAGILSVGIARLGTEICRWGDLFLTQLEDSAPPTDRRN